MKYRPHPQTSFGGLSPPSPFTREKIPQLRISKRGNLRGDPHFRMKLWIVILLQYRLVAQNHKFMKIRDQQYNLTLCFYLFFIPLIIIYPTF
jgi:hypothetical protein